MWQDNDNICYANKVVDKKVMNMIVVYIYKRKKQLCKKLYMAKKITNT